MIFLVLTLIFFVPLQASTNSCTTEDVYQQLDRLLSEKPVSPVSAFRNRMASMNLSEEFETYFRLMKEEHSVDMMNLPNLSIYRDFTNGSNPIVLGENLLKEFKTGNPEMNGYLKLGYREMVPLNQFSPVLQSPLNMSDLYTHIYNHLFKHLENGFSESDLVLPALILKKDNVIEYFRPLIDPFPRASEGWKLLVGNTELSGADFAKAIAEGKMPLEPSMYFHDMGHIVYDIERPELMGIRRSYYANEEKVLKGNYLPAHTQAGTYLNEFLITLRLRNSEKIKELLVPKSIISDESRLIELKADIVDGSMEKRIEAISKNFHTLFEGHGGGWLDGRSMHIFPSEISGEIDRRIYHPQLMKQKTINEYLTQTSYWGLVEQLKECLSNFLYYKGKPSQLRIDGGLVLAEEKYKEALAHIMLDLEKRSSAGLKHGIDNERIWRDVTVENFETTPTHNFFQELNRKNDGSISHETLEGQFLITPMRSTAKD